ncbi:glycosyltransferase family 4 protein [Kiloniella laminariae]|uniref:Glycosyltransferase family 4 protein n=1 Tax=Kiloniella laminariae TaxID=454162 RepID=A0ABT4LMG9_9PROT|nr:glycosyltransferase family 4 protein [Kiloniella laminariae]MCZ4282323.1 glycosyltransferase family 4 protein [Kiloniella laminariae]
MNNKNSRSLTYVSFEPLRQGHASYTHVIEIIEGLKKQGWDINLIAPAYNSTNLPGIISRLLAFAKLWFRTLLSPRTDIYYTRMHFAGFFVSLIGKLRKIPTVVEVNGPFDDLYIAWPSVKRFAFFFDKLMLGQMEMASAIITVTEGLKKYSETKLERSKKRSLFEVVPNGANTSIFKPIKQLPKRKDVAITPDLRDYASFYGTFAHWQGLDKLLDAATSSEWPPELDLRLAGDGALRQKVEKAAEDHSHIHYLGRINYQDMPYFVASSKLSFVLTQDISGRGQYGLYPLKMFEALAAGIPVITTQMPEQADIIINHECGLVLDNPSPESLCHAVKLLYNDDLMREKYGQNGRKITEEYYSWEKLASKTHLILCKVLSDEVHVKQ